jgi:hypothetical protein
VSIRAQRPLWSDPSAGISSLTACVHFLLQLAPAPPSLAEVARKLALEAAAGQGPADHRADALSPQAALSLGLRLRELHPPAAAVGLDDSAEFELHFLDSYAPLIRRALAVGQSALAWRGWECPKDSRWGVVVESGDPLLGFAPGCAGRLIPLVGPAHQVYIVEAIEPSESSRA